MVRDAVTDGRRIAQLLASELTGQGRFADCDVVDVDPDATPAPQGRVAYAVERADERVATVEIFPDHARVQLIAGDWPDPGRSDLSLAGDDALRVDRGAAVKSAVDAFAAALAGR
jgi:hypothetical protein